MRRRLTVIVSTMALIFAMAVQVGSGVSSAAPTGPTDETKVPHYFGPNTNWALSPLPRDTAVVTIVGDGSGATAEAVLDPGTGGIASIDVTDPGRGYTQAATSVEISGEGTGASASATVVETGAVSGFTVDAPGSGYDAFDVAMAGGGGQGTLANVGNPLIGRTYATDDAPGQGVFGVVPTVLPAGTLTAFETWNQADVTPASEGRSFHAYVLRPGAANEYQVVFDSGLLTVPAPTTPGTSEIARFDVPDTAVQAGDVLGFFGEGIPLDIDNGADVIAFPATTTAPVQGDTVTLGSAGFPLYGQAREYSFRAEVLDSTGVQPVTDATAVGSGGVDAVAIDDGGAGYTMPTVEFGLPDLEGGVRATGHAEMDGNGTITSIVVDEPGSGYTSPPAVHIWNGTQFDPNIGETPATLGTVTLKLVDIVVTDGGSGYTSPPTVTVSDPTGNGTGAQATASVMVGTISAIEVNDPGSGYLQGGIEKFQDPLPALCVPPACPSPGEQGLDKAIPLAVPTALTLSGQASDAYEIGLVQYRMRFSSSLPPTLVRGYVQLETPEFVAAHPGVSQHVPLTNTRLDGTTVDTGFFGVTEPQWLGPTIVAEKNKAVRIVFRNLLPTGADGDLFLPTDSSLMGSGMGPMGMADPADEGTVVDEVRNPLCTEYPKSDMCFADNRATLHLHGGNTPWISDGTPHQWITPAGENTDWPQGVSVRNVPDMGVCEAADDGCQTFYYTNQQSARLMFYHDHAWGITRLNVYAGEAAGYLIRDAAERNLFGPGGTFSALGDGIPLVVQDRTFVPEDWQLYNDGTPGKASEDSTTYGQDPTWDAARWGGYGNFWYHHVYMPAQNPGDPGGMSAYGRWMYGPWFFPPADGTRFGPIDNPFFDPACDLDDPATWQYPTDPFCEPRLIPGTPNVSVGMEQFNDTPIVNGTAYPTVTLDPRTYRFRVLNAANDRFFNFQWYVADPSQGNGQTEVALKPAELAAAQTDPVVFPTPVHNASTTGPDWVQIGTEGGFLPAPVTVDGQQETTWITDPTRFDVGNVDQHSLLLAPAERADVIVDFSQFAGKTLILYNDAPAAFPARVPSYDYYTGQPDLAPNGAPGVLPGYGPNTRTIMQVKIAANTPAPAFNRTALNNAFAHKVNGTGVFESSQHPIIVGQAAYNSAYGTNFAASSNCNANNGTLQVCDGLVRVNDTQQFRFNGLRAPRTSPLNLHVEPKAIHDEMNATTFDEFGRMQANLGLERQPPTPGTQNVTLYPFVNPTTELIDGTNLPKVDVAYDANGLPAGEVKVTPIASATDGTQVWRITHNGVDTHPIHFHAYDVQLVNRVTWDNIVIPPDPTELGWKDTVRVAPLEDTIVALRPVIPELPFEIPNSIRPMNPMMPLGSTAMFNDVDPNGIPTAAIANALVNFAGEFVYHCHILSHEEMDMMRPVTIVLPPSKPTALSYSIVGTGTAARVRLTWSDNSINETSFLVQRTTNGTTWVDVGTVDAPLGAPNVHEDRTFTDPTSNGTTGYLYRVVARNTAGYLGAGGAFPTMTAKSISDQIAVNPPAAPTSLTAVYRFLSTDPGPRITLSWRDNAVSETKYVVERMVDAGPYALLTELGPRAGSGSTVTFADTSVAVGRSYTYRISAVNIAGTGVSSPVTRSIGQLANPGNVTATATRQGNNNERVTLTWTYTTNGQTGFVVQRATNAAFTTGLTTSSLGAAARTYSTGIIGRNTYSFRIRAFNATGSSQWVVIGPIAPPA